MRESITKRIDAVTRIGEERLKSGVQEAPISVKIELTNRCNLKCKYCAVRTRSVPGKDEMDLGFFKAIVTDMKKAGVKEIGLFFLGESFCAPELLVNSIKACKDIGIEYTFLTSNATVAYPDVVRQCMEAGLDSLKWSVNCSDAEQWVHVTQSNEKWFYKALENIKVAWNLRMLAGYDKTMISASSILYEGKQALNMAEMLKEHVIPFVDTHYWLPLYQMSMYADRVEKELGFKPTHGNMGRLDADTMLPTRNPLPCWTCFTEGHVRVDGGLGACCFASDGRFDMGTLNGSNFMECWNSPQFVSLRESQIDTMKKGPEALRGTPCEVCVAY